MRLKQKNDLLFCCCCCYRTRQKNKRETWVEYCIDFRSLEFIEFISLCVSYHTAFTYAIFSRFSFVVGIAIFISLFICLRLFSVFLLVIRLCCHPKIISLFSYGSNVFKTHYEHVFIFDFMSRIPENARYDKRNEHTFSLSASSCVVQSGVVWCDCDNTKTS